MKYRRALDPRVSPIPALALWALAILIAALTCSCKEGGSPVEGCGLCAPAGTQPPPMGLVYSAMDEGKRQAVLTCPGAADVMGYPDVEWHACDFRMSGTCASGSTNAAKNLIRISLAEHDRVLPLVSYEARNFYWIMGGCERQAI